MNLSLRRIFAVARADISILAGSIRIGGNKAKKLNSSDGRGALIGFGALMVFVGLSYSVPAVLAMVEQYQVLGSGVVYTMMKNIYLLGLIFGFSLVYAAFFSGEDVERFLPLPIRASELVIGKYLATSLFISIIFGLYSLPGFITFGIVSRSGPAFYILLPIIILLSAGLLTAIFGSLNLLIAGFASLFKRARRTVAYACSTVLGLVLMVYYVTSSATMYIAQSPSKNPVLYYFEYVLMGYGPSKVLAGDRIPAELGWFFLNFLIWTGVFAVLGHLLYIRGLAGFSSASAKRSKLKAGELLKSAGGGNARLSYLAKEFRMLVRSPMVAMNSLLSAFIFPIMIIGGLLYLRFGGTDEDLVQLVAMLQSLDSSMMIGTLLGGSFIAGLFMSGMNLLGVSSISREGKNLFVMKYIPIPIFEQIMLKYAFAVAIGVFSTLLGILPVAFYIGLTGLEILMVSIAAVIGALLSQAIGLLFDVNSPYLNWDVDYKAVKQNINFLWWSLVCLGLTAGSVALMMMPGISVWLSAVLFILVPLLLLTASLALIYKLTKSSFARLI